MALLMLLSLFLVTRLPSARAHCLPEVALTGGMTVTYQTGAVEFNSVLAHFGIAQLTPTLGTTETPSGDLLLVMVDPDAPCKLECPDKYWLHWLAKAQVKEGVVVVQTEYMVYAGPTPPPNTGYHRYQFLLYSGLTEDIPQNKMPTTRSNFELDVFTCVLGLTATPIASFQYKVESMKLEGVQSICGTTPT